jgi:hypothetical protein
MQRADNSNIQAMIMKGKGEASHHIAQATGSDKGRYLWAYKKNFHLRHFMNSIRFMAESDDLATAFGVLNKIIPVLLLSVIKLLNQIFMIPISFKLSNGSRNY